LNSARALYAEGEGLYQAGNFSEALARFVAACVADPGMACSWNGRAIALSAMGRDEEAINTLAEGDLATNGDISVLINLATLLLRRACHDQIEDIAKRVFAIAPNHALMGLTLGVAFLKQGRIEEGISLYRYLVNTHPDNPDLFNNLGELLMVADEYGEALAAYQRASSLSPARIEPRIGQWQALAMLERFEEADQLYLELTASSPKEAMACFRRMGAQIGQRIPPDWQGRAVEVFLSRRWRQQQFCDWRFRTDYLDRLCRYVEQMKATIGAIHDASLAFQSHSAPIPAAYRRELLDAVTRNIVATAGPPVRRRLARVSPIMRIGFISPNFREHPSAQLNWRMLDMLDRTRFEVAGYSLCQGDGPLRQRIIAACDTFKDVSSLSSWEIAKRIALDGIDILVDLGGYVDHSRPDVLALRPSSLQVSFLGAAGATGMELVDYRITDHFTTPPEDAAFWSEKLVFLPNTVAIYNNQEEIAATRPSRLACGLSERSFVFCCFNASYKIEPEVFSVWMRLLAQVPDSVLWLLDTGEVTSSNLRREAMTRGIAPERLIFAPRLPRAEHLARHACADLFIDTFYCGAMATAGDALWAGLPVLTCSGSTMAARMSGTIVRAADLPELVAPDRETYESLALRLATQPTELAALREKLARNRATCALFDTPGRVRDLGRAFTMMWKRHAAGLPPASFDVPDGDN
jgi:predicted O-linked N-acetylglucosamine transferase (SPINDLY family)